VSRTCDQKRRSSCINKRHSPDNFEAQFSVISWNMQLLLTGKQISDDPLCLPTAFGNSLTELTKHIASKVLPNSIVKLINFPLNPSACHQFQIAISPLRSKPRHENECRSEAVQFQEILSQQWRGKCDQLQPSYALPKGGKKSLAPGPVPKQRPREISIPGIKSRWLRQ
jgi:hypothetical protein